MAGSSRWRLEKLEGMRGVITFRSDGEVRVESGVARPRGIALPPVPSRAEPRRMPEFL